MNLAIMHITSEAFMAAIVAARHKHVRIDQAKLDKARRVLDAATDTETLDRALTLVVTGTEVQGVLRCPERASGVRPLDVSMDDMQM